MASRTPLLRDDDDPSLSWLAAVCAAPGGGLEVDRREAGGTSTGGAHVTLVRTSATRRPASCAGAGTWPQACMATGASVRPSCQRVTANPRRVARLLALRLETCLCGEAPAKQRVGAGVCAGGEADKTRAMSWVVDAPPCARHTPRGAAAHAAQSRGRAVRGPPRAWEAPALRLSAGVKAACLPRTGASGCAAAPSGSGDTAPGPARGYGRPGSLDGLSEDDLPTQGRALVNPQTAGTALAERDSGGSDLAYLSVSGHDTQACSLTQGPGVRAPWLPGLLPPQRTHPALPMPVLFTERCFAAPSSGPPSGVDGHPAAGAA